MGKRAVGIPDNESKIASIPFQGGKLSIHGRPGDPYFEGLSINSANEFFEFVVSKLPADSVCMDIGANVGLTTAMLASGSRHVHCFEPSPPTFGLLRKTLAANDLKNVTANPMAVGESPGTIPFFDNPTSASASHLVSGETLGHVGTASVELTTIDGYVAAKRLDRLDFIKIDIEGFEIDALRGGEATIRKMKPMALVEFNSFTMQAFRDISPRDFLRYFLALFPFVYRWSDNRAVHIDSDAAALSFLHDHLVSAGCVDDLLGSFSPFSP